MYPRRMTTRLVLLAHDPDGRYRAVLNERQDGFASYDGVFVAVTSTTDPTLTVALQRSGAIVVTCDPSDIGASQRSVLSVAREQGGASEFLCGDFDRWLHWRGSYPDELAQIPGRIAQIRPRPWYVCLGRTARAFATHPGVQRSAEFATNRALSLASGRRLDATGGAWWISIEGVDLVLAESVERSKATDLEWPSIILRADRRRLAGIATEGLEFETADFYSEEIAAAGDLAAWMEATYDRPAMWRDRLRLAADSVMALTRVLGDVPR